MATGFWRGGESDGGGENDGGGARENDGGGRLAGPCGPLPFNPGPLPGWDTVFDTMGHPKIVVDAVFPRDGWDPAMLMDRIALDFAASACWKDGTESDPGLPPGHVAAGADDAAKQKALQALIADVEALLLLKQDLVDEKLEAEIAYQAGDILSYFMKLASCSAEVRVNMQFLLMLCLRIAAIVVRHYKLTYMRARPVQVIPSLDPLIPTPRHPSYPSGHALQAHLMAVALAEVAPALGARAAVLAGHIALNRERAGLHFRADSAASARIAGPVWACLTKLTEVSNRVDAAKKEHSGTEFALPPESIDRIEAPARERAAAEAELGAQRGA